MIRRRFGVPQSGSVNFDGWSRPPLARSRGPRGPRPLDCCLPQRVELGGRVFGRRVPLPVRVGGELGAVPRHVGRVGPLAGEELGGLLVLDESEMLDQPSERHRRRWVRPVECGCVQTADLPRELGTGALERESSMSVSLPAIDSWIVVSSWMSRSWEHRKLNSGRSPSGWEKLGAARLQPDGAGAARPRADPGRLASPQTGSPTSSASPSAPLVDTSASCARRGSRSSPSRGRYGGYRVGRGLRLPPLVFSATEALAS